jgi:hypothetical protein
MIVAGCGGSDDGTAASGSLTKAEFIEKGNAICAQTNQQFEEEFSEFEKEHSLSGTGELSNPELIEAAEDIFLPTITLQMEELRALDVPSGEESKVNELLNSAEKGLREAKEKPETLLVQGGGPFAEANKLAKEYGLDKCAE